MKSCRSLHVHTVVAPHLLLGYHTQGSYQETLGLLSLARGPSYYRAVSLNMNFPKYMGLDLGGLVWALSIGYGD